MSAVMLERDGVMAAVRGLLRDALGGRGGALFVVGEAGLGKTTVLQYAAAVTGDRFRSGIGRADVAEAALPFGLIGQALDPLLDGHATPPARPPLPLTTSTPCWRGCGLPLADRCSWRSMTRTGPTRTR